MATEPTTTSDSATPQESVAKAGVCIAVATVCGGAGIAIMLAAWLTGDFKMLFLACAAWTCAFLMKTVEGSFLRAALK